MKTTIEIIKKNSDEIRTAMDAKKAPTPLSNDAWCMMILLTLKKLQEEVILNYQQQPEISIEDLKSMFEVEEEEEDKEDGEEDEEAEDAEDDEDDVIESLMQKYFSHKGFNAAMNWFEIHLTSGLFLSLTVKNQLEDKIDGLHIFEGQKIIYML